MHFQGTSPKVQKGDNMEPKRLQKFLAECGIASRRKCEELILEGKVKVNGNVVTELGTKVVPGQDIVTYDGKEKEVMGAICVLSTITYFNRINCIISDSIYWIYFLYKHEYL